MLWLNNNLLTGCQVLRGKRTGGSHRKTSIASVCQFGKEGAQHLLKSKCRNLLRVTDRLHWAVHTQMPHLLGTHRWHLEPQLLPQHAKNWLCLNRAFFFFLTQGEDLNPGDLYH